ncbi:uncharacterized protein LOC116842046 [Odontomachus brunneus]|uniref:uncharacterized protein LOC116842046 n=1 Tax=Odontomachus brunneus TaxID=486640 RepID=UPI0013F27CA5|nr:uncharacterized protein LOC116842046 [Odontomachus brunneus]
MLSVLVLTVLLGIINRSIAFFEYSDDEEKISVKFFGKSDFFSLIDCHYPICLNVTKNITENDQLYFDIVETSGKIQSDNVQFPTNHSEELCDLLKDLNRTLVMDMFLSVFGMEEKHCPIMARDVLELSTLEPELFTHLGNGHFKFTVTLEKSENASETTYFSYLGANITLDLQTKHCIDNINAFGNKLLHNIN